MRCQHVTLSGDAEWPKVADAVIEALIPIPQYLVSRAFEAVHRLMSAAANVIERA